jgi:hypothetical protein
MMSIYRYKVPFGQVKITQNFVVDSVLFVKTSGNSADNGHRVIHFSDFAIVEVIMWRT